MFTHREGIFEYEGATSVVIFQSLMLQLEGREVGVHVFRVRSEIPFVPKCKHRHQTLELASFQHLLYDPA